MRTCLDVVESKDLCYGALLSRRFHCCHNTPLKAKEIVNKAFSLRVCASLQAVMNISDEFFVSNNDLCRGEKKLKRVMINDILMNSLRDDHDDNNKAARPASQALPRTM